MSVGRMRLENGMLGKLAVAEVLQYVQPLTGVGNEQRDIGKAVVVEVVNLSLDRAGKTEQNRFSKASIGLRRV